MQYLGFIVLPLLVQCHTLVVDGSCAIRILLFGYADLAAPVSPGLPLANRTLGLCRTCRREPIFVTYRWGNNWLFSLKHLSTLDLGRDLELFLPEL
ncbi:hypothetical protein HOY82DRAFT_59986 [Tuber indicum]|nr:hypothetical protein HOY82DRAFT_59986 [Tuber indicum]